MRNNTVNMANFWKSMLFKNFNRILIYFGVAHQIFGFNKVERGYFTGSTYRTINSFGLFLCAKQCVLQKHCQSFNFIGKQMKCELNRLARSSPGDALFDPGIPDSYYGDVNNFIGDVSIAGACASRVCNLGETCISLTGASNAQIKCIQTECEAAPSLTNANALSNFDYQYRVGDSLEYTCLSGYIANGNLTTVCLFDGRWSSVTPSECKDCGTPPGLESGQVNPGSKTIGSTRTYSCKGGYSGVGTNSVLCQQNGEWSTLAYECKPDCINPPSIEHATPSGSVISFGHYVIYTCQTGFGINTVDGIMCEDGGTWGANHVVCVPTDCGTPPGLASGQVNVGSNAIGSTRTYSCNSGHSGVGTNSVTCQQNGEWSALDYECKPDCTNPPNVDFGTPTSSTVSYGHYVYYICQTGYRIHSADRIRCEDGGTWSTNYVVCAEEIDCGVPPNPPNTHAVSSTPSTYGTIKTYRCRHNYKADGYMSIHCQADGYWTNIQFTCRES